MRGPKSVHELAEEVGGMYALVVGAAKRAKQLREGRQRVTESASANPLTVALQEIVEGKIVVRPPGEKDEPEAEAEVVEVSGAEAEAEDGEEAEPSEEGAAEAEAKAKAAEDESEPEKAK